MGCGRPAWAFLYLPDCVAQNRIEEGYQTATPVTT
jgi:hypothetical protein